MGRTNPTFRDFLERYEGEFGDYRRGLRRQGRTDFDRLFERARAYADAAGYANHLDRDRLVLFSMALGHEAALRERRERIEDLECELERLSREVEELREDDERCEDDDLREGERSEPSDRASGGRPKAAERANGEERPVSGEVASREGERSEPSDRASGSERSERHASREDAAARSG